MYPPIATVKSLPAPKWKRPPSSRNRNVFDLTTVPRLKSTLGIIFGPIWWRPQNPGEEEEKKGAEKKKSRKKKSRNIK